MGLTKTKADKSRKPSHEELVHAVEAALPDYKVVELADANSGGPSSDGFVWKAADVQLPSLAEIKRKHAATFGGAADAVSTAALSEEELFGNGERIMFVEPRQASAADGGSRKRLSVVIGDDGVIRASQG